MCEGQRVLLVEDDESIAFVLLDVLADEDFEVRHVTDGKQAVEVHVLEGLVELESSATGTQEAMRREHLHAGEARRSEANETWVSATFDADRFVPMSPPADRGMPAALT